MTLKKINQLNLECGPIFKVFIELPYSFCFMFCFFSYEACGILVPWPRIKPAPPALEGKVLTVGLPGKSPSVGFLFTWIFTTTGHYYWVIVDLGSGPDTTFFRITYFSGKKNSLSWLNPKSHITTVTCRTVKLTVWHETTEMYLSTFHIQAHLMYLWIVNGGRILPIWISWLLINRHLILNTLIEFLTQSYLK